MMDEGLKEINKEIFRHYWYSKNEAVYEIVKAAQFKEMVFIDKAHEAMPMRCMFIYKVDMLKEHFSRARFLNYPDYNLYLSCAYYKNTPQFSYDPKTRREQMDAWSGMKGHSQQYIDHITGYDFFCDFDSAADDISDAHDDAFKLKTLLDKHKVPYTITFSGAKGFHIRVPFKALPQGIGMKIVMFCKALGEALKEKMKLSTLDIGVFDDRRVFKAPYSYDRGNICLPLDDEQFNNFDINKMRVTWVLQNIKIFNRGLLMRHDDCDAETQRERFRAFLSEVKG
jgi:hypothetical protein